MAIMLFVKDIILIILSATLVQTTKVSGIQFKSQERNKTNVTSTRVVCKDGVNKTLCQISKERDKQQTSKHLSNTLAAIQGDQPVREFCFCNKFASKGMQCNPDTPYEPCKCLPNFTGRRCQRCMPGYYGFPDCLPCKCNPEGSADMVCDKRTGRCPCKVRIRGMKCDLCPLGHFDFPRCKACLCDDHGSHSFLCNDTTGQCSCRQGMYGRQCNQCPPGYYNFPKCWWCGCNGRSTTKQMCNENGDCICKHNYKGNSCSECQDGFYSYPSCTACDCKSGFGKCGKSGECICLKGYAGRFCDKCAEGYYGFPSCTECNCNLQGSHSVSTCHQITGKCQCKINVIGKKCDSCVKGLVGFPDCKQCSCNPYGTRPRPGGGTTCFGFGDMRCLCKSNVEGKICDRCRYGFYNFSENNPAACSPCACSNRGSLIGVHGCDFTSGVCNCKSYVTGTKCDTCKNGTYGLMSRDIFGCRECSCDHGGSVNSICNAKTGQCQCHPGIDGVNCDRIAPSSRAYFPTLHHIKAELEDAFDDYGIPVRTGFDQSKFPWFSGMGYVIPTVEKSFSVDIEVPVSSAYQVIINYALSSKDSTTADLSLSPKGVSFTTYRISQIFRPTDFKGSARSRLITLQKNRQNIIVKLKKGTWTAFFYCRSKDILIDYMVLLPEDYYTGSALKYTNVKPCKAYPNFNNYCTMYKYHSTSHSQIVHGIHGFVGNGQEVYKYSEPKFDLKRLDYGNSIALLGKHQKEIYFEIQEQKAGSYILVTRYLNPDRQVHRVSVHYEKYRAKLVTIPCDHRFACQQVVTDALSGPMKFKFKGKLFRNKVSFIAPSKANIGIISIAVFEESMWNATYITPFFHCYYYQHKCTKTLFSTPRGSSVLVNYNYRSGVFSQVIMNGRVENDGNYYIVIHYKLSALVESKGEVSVFASQTVYVTLPYCPAVDGCRAKVSLPNLKTISLRKGVASVILRFPRQVQIENVVLVPEKAMTLEVLKPFPRQKIDEFLLKCSKRSFYTNPKHRQNLICLKAIFSMTLSFLGHVPICNCDVQGSRSLKCKQFGGQCRCKRNVVGRRCDRCPVGYSGFPQCRKCSCSPEGSASRECDINGQCTCLPGVGGIKCDRCQSSEYFGFPLCQKCNCDGHGSLSMFCSQKRGQCQCRRNFGGVKCNRCRIGYYDFPKCKQCNCNPGGMLVLPGQENTCGSSNDQSCTCKANVQGSQCGECKDLYYGLSALNPLGCQACQCNTNGTLGSISTCNKDNGDCLCKQFVTGRVCSRCKRGYYNLMEWDIFGCTKCSCNSGGAFGTFCDAQTGQCICRPGITGRTCNRITPHTFFYHDLHHIRIELEDATSDNGQPVVVRDDERLFRGFTWKGFTELNSYQSRIFLTTAIPRTTRYQLIFHYSLSGSASVDALLKFQPTSDSRYLPSGRPKPFQIGVRFKTTSTWRSTDPQFLTVLDSKGIPVEVSLSRGKWKLSLAARPSYIYLDHLVLLPEDYYKPTILGKDVNNKCQVGDVSKYCLQYKHPSMNNVGFSTIQAEKSIFTGPKSDFVQPPFQGVTLNGYQNVLTIQLPRDHPSGTYIFVTTFYYEDYPVMGRLEITWSSGRQTQRGWFSIFTCRYTSACRQVAIADNKQIKSFDVSGNSVTTISLTTSLTVAVDSVAIIPKSKWDQSYLLPAPRCVKDGKACIASTFAIPARSVVIEAENNTDTINNGHVSPRPAYLIDNTIKFAHIATAQRTIYINAHATPGSYFVVVHFFQPDFLSFTGSVIVSHSGSAVASRVDFRHCPHVSGCRSPGTSTTRLKTKNRIYLNYETDLLVTVTIPDDKSVWIDYILLVPTFSFLPSLLEQDPVDMTSEFKRKCAQNHYFIKPTATKFCHDSVFTLTTRFNNGGTLCGCNQSGSLNKWCQSYGGQCRCKNYVTGRTCNTCKTGYTGFPNCRRR